VVEEQSPYVNAGTILTTGCQLWTVQMTAENISVWRLTNLSTLWLFAYLRYRNTLRYLLRWLLEKAKWSGEEWRVCILCFRSRCSARSCMEHAWLRKNFTHRSATLPVRTIAVARLADFIERRKHQVCCCLTKFVTEPLAWYWVEMLTSCRTRQLNIFSWLIKMLWYSITD